MFYKCIFIFLFIYLVLGAENVTKQREGKILEGNVAVDGQFPQQALLRIITSWNKTICSGAIISDMHVLTAAHCLDRAYPMQVEVKTGDNFAMFLKSYKVKKFYIHDGYRKGFYNDDLAILEVEIPFDFLKPQKMLPAEIHTTKVQENKNCTVSGWGYWKEGTSIWDSPHNLLYANVSIYNKKKCSYAYQVFKIPITDSMTCAYTIKGDACTGDDGSPLICDNKLTGIASFGYGCMELGYPKVYTDITKYRAWISSITGSGGHHLYVSWSLVLLMILSNIVGY